MGIRRIGVDHRLTSDIPAGRPHLKATVGQQIRGGREVGVIEPKGARREIVGVDREGDHVGGRLVDRGHSVPTPTAAKRNYTLSLHDALPISVFQHPYAAASTGS